MFSDLIWLYIGLIVVLFLIAITIIAVGTARSHKRGGDVMSETRPMPDRPNPAQMNTPINPEVRDNQSHVTTDSDINRDRV